MADVDAIEWLTEHMRQHVICSVGMLWLRHALRHLEDRIDAELRRTR